MSERGPVQQINLYNAAFVPPREVVTPQAVALMAAFSVLIVVLGGAWAQRDAAAWEQQLQGLQAAQQLAQTELDAARKALESRQPDAALKLKLEQERAKLAQRERVLQVTHLNLTQSHGGFSPYVRGLARQGLPGVWVTGLTVDGQPLQLSLSGRALKKELVPDYVRRLNAEPAFAGKTFAGLDMKPVSADGEKVPASMVAMADPAALASKKALPASGGVLEFHLVAERTKPEETASP